MFIAISESVASWQGPCVRMMPLDLQNQPSLSLVGSSDPRCWIFLTWSSSWIRHLILSPGLYFSRSKINLPYASHCIHLYSKNLTSALSKPVQTWICSSLAQSEALSPWRSRGLTRQAGNVPRGTCQRQGCGKGLSHESRTDAAHGPLTWTKYSNLQTLQWVCQNLLRTSNKN